MNSKDIIIDRLQELKRADDKIDAQYPYPQLDFDCITYCDKIEAFTTACRASGAEVVLAERDEPLDEIIRRLYPTAKVIASTMPEIGCATINPDTEQSAVELANTDLGVVDGVFGVAENGAVWVRQEMKYKAIYFVSEALVIVLDRNSIVNNMGEAYALDTLNDFRYSCFICGPSKTADIEQALVIGAQAARATTVILI